MNVEKYLPWLLIVGGIVHLLLGIGQGALVAAIPYVSIIQILVGIAAVYMLYKKVA